MARDAHLVLRLSDAMKFRFQRLADRRGVTMSALGAVIIGSWVDAEETKERVAAEMVAGAQDTFRQKMDEPISDEQFQLLEGLMPGLRNLLQSVASDKGDEVP